MSERVRSHSWSPSSSAITPRKSPLFQAAISRSKTLILPRLSTGPSLCVVGSAAVKGELIRLGDTTVRFLVEGADSGGSAAVFEVGISARGKVPAPHSHDSFEETIYGLEGVSTWMVEDAAVDLAPAEALCIPRGAVH